MPIIRIILFVFLVLLGRRFYLALKSAGSGRKARFDHHRADPSKGELNRDPQGVEDLTEQDISDADFEEIP